MERTINPFGPFSTMVVLNLVLFLRPSQTKARPNCQPYINIVSPATLTSFPLEEPGAGQVICPVGAADDLDKKKGTL